MTAGTASAPMVFISYRRDDSGGHVGRLYDALSARFGRQRLFFDIDHIAPGQDFVQVLDDSLNRCSVLLVVIGKRWAGGGKIGSRRIDDPGDFVRLEVAAGLKRQGLRVIPVLIQGAKMPGPKALPDDLKDLSRRNAIELSDLRWKEDVARLIAGLEPDMRSGEHPAVAIQDWVKRARVPSSISAASPWARWAGVAGIVILLGWGVKAAFGGHKPGASDMATGALAAEMQIPHNEPPKMPSHVDDAAHQMLAKAQKEWRKDAMLTEIEATLPDSGPDANVYHVAFDFRSPTDGAGLRIEPGAPHPVVQVSPVGRSALHALPDNFVDLPDAVAAAHQAGMFGDLRDARLTQSASHTAHALWRIKSNNPDDPRSYYVDAITGKMTMAPVRGGPDIFGKIGKIFHH